MADSGTSSPRSGRWQVPHTQGCCLPCPDGRAVVTRSQGPRWSGSVEAGGHRRALSGCEPGFAGAGGAQEALSTLDRRLLLHLRPASLCVPRSGSAHTHPTGHPLGVRDRHRPVFLSPPVLPVPSPRRPLRHLLPEALLAADACLSPPWISSGTGQHWLSCVTSLLLSSFKLTSPVRHRGPRRAVAARGWSGWRGRPSHWVHGAPGLPHRPLLPPRGGRVAGGVRACVGHSCWRAGLRLGAGTGGWPRDPALPLTSPEVRGVCPVPPVIGEAEGTCFFFSPDRPRIVWIMNISSGVTGDRRLGIDLAREGYKNRKFNTLYSN